MAVVSAVIDRFSKDELTVTWTGLTPGDTGEPVSVSQYRDRTFQSILISGSGAVTIEGSNDGTNWVTLGTNKHRFVRPNNASAGSVIDIILYCVG